MHLGFLDRPFVPHNLMSSKGSPVPLLKFQVAHILRILISSGSKKKEPKYACLGETRASHSHKTWRFLPLLHSSNIRGINQPHWVQISSPCVLCPVRRPVSTLDCVLLKDRNLVFVVGLGPKVKFWACLWVLIRPQKQTQWLQKN